MLTEEEEDGSGGRQQIPVPILASPAGTNQTAKELGRSSHEGEKEAGSLLAGEGRCAVIGRKGESFHGA